MQIKYDDDDDDNDMSKSAFIWLPFRVVSKYLHALFGFVANMCVCVCVCVCDRRTDRQTDKITTPKTALA